MEKRLRSSLQTSADEFLSSAGKLPLKSAKPAIKSLINTSVKPCSDLTSTLPVSLRNSISHSISQFKNLSDSTFALSPVTPPAKRVRRSARNKKDDGASPTKRGRKERQSIVEKLRVYAYVLHLCAFHPKRLFSVADLLPPAQELHDNLILFESDSGLLAEIANLCEEWWKGDLFGKEALISQSLPVFLSRSLTLKKKVDVHRIYTLRDAFTLFDFEDESIEDLKHLLIRCVLSPLYMKTEEGRKFVAFICGLSVQLTKEVCAMIKSQIPFGRKSILEAYGEIVFRAWKAVDRECKCEMEKGFLQGLIEGTIYASSAALAASIRRILGAFVNSRTTEGVEKLFFVLAEPVIFRSLQVANSNVRQNALHLLLDLFPLEDPDATKEVKDTLLEKQFFLLEKLLMDECPDVRLVAVEGSCRILHLFWEIIPSPTITKIITKIFEFMTDDCCTEVRLSTVNGVIYLLGNPQSHEVLKVLLPKLGKLIMDSASVVRAAVADLLLLLNDIRNFHFHKVVSVDVLLLILANDQPFIGRKITKLLIPSYFSSEVTVEEACKRCITLIKRLPAAGARFCEFAALEGASLRPLMKLMKVIIGLILSPVKLGEELIEGLLVAVSHLCTNLAVDASLRAAVKEELSVGKLKNLFAVASTPRAHSSICNIILTMSLDSVDALFENCMDLITRSHGLSGNVERQAEVRSAHKMILLYGWFEDMFEVLVRILQNAAQGCHLKFGIEAAKQNLRTETRKEANSVVRASSRSKHGNRQKPSNTAKARFSEDYANADGVAWQIKELLVSENTREVMLGSGTLENAFSALKVISEACIVHCNQYDYLNTTPVSAYASLALHMSLHNIKSDGNMDFAQANILEFTLDHLLHCTHKVLRANKKSGNLLSDLTASKVAPSRNTGELPTGSNVTKQTSISNMVKMLTAVLRFIVDAASMNLAPRHQEQCLNFTIENSKFIIKVLRECSIAQLEFDEEDLKDMFICLKSSLTYGAKLLNTVLTTCEVPVAPQGSYSLVNELFNVITAVEEFLGFGYAVRLDQAVQPWIPDLILAFASYYLMKQTPDEGGSSDSPANAKPQFPSWFCVVARIELCELRDASSEEETGTEKVQFGKDYSAFKRLVEAMSKTLKSNNNILDAVGVIFLTGSLSAMQGKNFDVVFGILHFVCVKLVGPDITEWKELKLMLPSLEELYSAVESEIEDPSNSENDQQKLQAIKALLEPIWASLTHDGRRHSMEED